MTQRKSVPYAIRRPILSLFVVFVTSLGLLALLIAYSGALPSKAAISDQDPQSVRLAGLEIKNHVQDSVLVNEWLTYTLVFTNASNLTLDHVLITDTWNTNAVKPDNPPPAEYNGNLSDPDGVVDSHTWVVGAEAGALYINVGTLDPHESATLVFTMGVPDVLEPNFTDPKIGPSTLGNSAVIGTSTPGVENAYDVPNTMLVGPVFKLTKAVVTEWGDGNKERPGRLVTFTLSLRNLNAEDDARPDAWPATGVEVWDDIPDELTFISAQPPGQYIASVHRISWTLPLEQVFNPGETAYFNFTARVTTTDFHYTIKNAEKDCSAMAAERLTPVHCVSDVTVKVKSPLEKVVQTRNPPSAENITFPGRTITYTVFVYNPLQDPVSDLRVTDTLPVDYFTFAGMLGGGPAPTGSTANTVVWEGLSLPPNGVISFSFRVFVDEQTPVSNDCSDKTYKNTLAAASSGFPIVYDTDSFSFNPVKVTKQIKLSKSVEPSKQLAGGLVTYTIKVDNLGDTAVTLSVLTDTLPTDFRYDSMVSVVPGPPAGQSGNLIWWDDVPAIGAGETLEFSFRVTAEGVPGDKYKNRVTGYSPDTYICAISTAEVTILSPLVGEKTADPPAPEPIVQGESFEYTVNYANQSSLSSYCVDEFMDGLPDGFFDLLGRPVYTYSVEPCFELQPSQANFWGHTFSAQVIGEGSGTTWCNDLASEGKRDIAQAKETFGIHTVSPDGWWVNESAQATVYVKPHVDLLHNYLPSSVGVGMVTTVTLTLSNNLRSPADPVNFITVTYEVRDGFTYLGVLPGTPEPDYSGGYLIWSPIHLGSSDTVELNFRLQVPSEVKTYDDIVAYAYAADADICIPMSKESVKVVKGVTLKKTPDLREVGPYGTVEYDLLVKNLTGVPVTGIRITDTLPPDWTYAGQVSDHIPVSTEPPIWEIPRIEAFGTENIRFKARAYVYLGPQYNYVDGVSASTYVTLYAKLADYEKNVEVTVIPGVGLYKTVTPERTEAGQPVTYTINLYNGSNRPLANIVLTDTLPDGFSFAGMLDGATPVLSQGSLVVWEIDRLGNAESIQLVFQADTDLNLFSDTYYNQISGEAWDATDPGSAIDVPSTDLTAPVIVKGLPTVERSKSVSPSMVRAGNLVTYTITLYNEMDEDQTLRLTDTLPLSLTFDSVVAPTPQPLQTSPVVWQDVLVSSQHTVTLVFRARVDLYTRSGTYYNRLDAAIGATRLPPLARTAPLEVEEIPRYDLQVTKTDGRITVDEGETLAYTITYTNLNAAELGLTDVVITETFSPLPPYANPVGTSADWEQIATNVFTHYVGGLAPGESGSVQFGLQLSDSIPIDVWVVSNTVEIGHDTDELAFETAPGNNRHTDLDILRGPDLVVGDLEISPDTPRAGKPITFSVTVRNQGKNETLNSDGSGWFYVELYLKGSDYTPAGPPVDVFDHVGGWWPDSDHSEEREAYLCTLSGLGAGSEGICTFVITDVTDADDYYVYAQVDVSFDDRPDWPWTDDYGFVQEAIETNNISSYGLVHVQKGGIFLPIIFRGY